MHFDGTWIKNIPHHFLAHWFIENFPSPEQNKNQNCFPKMSRNLLSKEGKTFEPYRYILFDTDIGLYHVLRGHM